MAWRRSVPSLFTGLPRGTMSLERPVVTASWDTLPPTQPPSKPRVPGCSVSPASSPLAYFALSSLKLCAFWTWASRLRLILALIPGKPVRHLSWSPPRPVSPVTALQPSLAVSLSVPTLCPAQDLAGTQ